MLLESQPQRGQAVEGETLVLVCSVAEGTEDATVSWYREDAGEDLGRKSEHSQRAELEVLAVREGHSGDTTVPLTTATASSRASW